MEIDFIRIYSIGFILQRSLLYEALFYEEQFYRDLFYNELHKPLDVGISAVGALFYRYLFYEGSHKSLLNRDLLLLIYNRLIQSQQQMLLQVPELIPSRPFTNPLLEFVTKCSWSSLGKFLHNPLSNFYLCQWNMLSELAGAFLQGPTSDIHCKPMNKCSWSILGRSFRFPLSKSSLEIYGKSWWRSLGQPLHISFISLCYQSEEHGPGSGFHEPPSYSIRDLTSPHSIVIYSTGALFFWDLFCKDLFYRDLFYTHLFYRGPAL